VRDASLPSPDARKLASLLQRKAIGDEAILERLLDDHDIPDDALGFHVQQTVEKRLKAVLAPQRSRVQHTHSIGYLTTLLEHHGSTTLEPREPREDLTPWAIDARYGDQLSRSLDRVAVRKLIESVREWSDSLLGPSSPTSRDPREPTRPEIAIDSRSLAQSWRAVMGRWRGSAVAPPPCPCPARHMHVCGLHSRPANFHQRLRMTHRS
jgi:HEPN domain-containing protein